MNPQNSRTVAEIREGEQPQQVPGLIARLVDPQASPFPGVELSPREIAVLMLVAPNKQVSSIDAVAALHLPPATITAVAGLLVRKGLLLRSCSGFGSETMFKVTVRGRMLYDSIRRTQCGLASRTSDVAGSDQRERIALAAADLGMWTLDLLSGHVGMDDRPRLHLGANANVALSAELAARIHPEDPPAVRRTVAAALDPATTGLLRAEYRLRRADGAWRWISACGVVRHSMGNHIERAAWIIGTTQDITERKIVEASLRRSNEALEQFAFAVSHDLREPLRTVRAFSELLGRQCRGQMDPTGDKYLRFFGDCAPKKWPFRAAEFTSQGRQNLHSAIARV